MLTVRADGTGDRNSCRDEPATLRVAGHDDPIIEGIIECICGAITPLRFVVQGSGALADDVPSTLPCPKCGLAVQMLWD
jgi:hypothetical protein